MSQKNDPPKQYRLLLIGNEEITISEADKKRVEDAIENKLGNVAVGRSYIKTSSIKAILELKGASLAPQNDQMLRAEREWNDLCLSMSRLTSLQKTDREMQVRILPGWKKHGLSESDAALSDAYGAIFDFFEENPVYPRCPARIWWPILSPKIKESPMKSLWYQYVFRNDEAIANWVKWQKT